MVFVGIEQGQGAAVEFEAFYRAGERHPQLFIEFAEVAQVISRFDADLIKAPGTKKAEAVAAARCKQRGGDIGEGELRGDVRHVMISPLEWAER